MTDKTNDTQKNTNNSGISRRGIIQGAVAATGSILLTGGIWRPAKAQSYQGELTVSNWGGDWNTNVVNALEQPELESKGMAIKRDLASAPARKTKIIAEKNLPRGTADVAQFTDADAYELHLPSPTP